MISSSPHDTWHKISDKSKKSPKEIPSKMFGEIFYLKTTLSFNKMPVNVNSNLYKKLNDLFAILRHC